MRDLVSGLVAAAVVVATMVVAPPASAHHSFPATYNLDKEQKIEGTVVQFMLRNPHTVIQVMAPGEDGKMYRWSVEWAAAGTLERTTSNARDLLSPGDVVIVRGAPSRDASAHKLRLNSIERPSDGWKWGGKFN